MLKKRNLPKHLIERYWRSVRGLLQEKYGLTAKSSRMEADLYWHELEPLVGDILYHKDAKDVARTIATGFFWDRVQQLLLERILLIGFDEAEAAELSARLPFECMSHEMLPRIVVQAGNLLAESPEGMRYRRVSRVVFHGIFEDDLECLAGLALWGGPCFPNPTATGKDWRKSVHGFGAEFMPADRELVADTQAVKKGLGLDIIANDYMVSETGRYLLEVNHIPSVTCMPELWQEYVDVVLTWVEKSSKPGVDE